MEINWTKTTQARRAPGASRHGRPATVRLARAGTCIRAVLHDQRSRGDGEVTAQRARAFATRVPGTPGPAKAGWARDGLGDAQTAPVVDHPTEPVAKRTEGTDRVAIPSVARACVKDRGRSRAQDRIAAGRQRHGELARV
jgi:hypothetical protein